MISMIVAMDENGLIGKNNSLPWHLPNDLKYFKRITIGNTIIMGRKTYDSIGKPLPGRKNVVLTRNENHKIENVTIINTPDMVQELALEENVFIIGGSELFSSLIGITDKLYITKIYEKFDGDVFFPNINWEEWEVECVEEGIVDDKNIYKHDFYIYKRK